MDAGHEAYPISREEAIMKDTNACTLCGVVHRPTLGISRVSVEFRLLTDRFMSPYGLIQYQ
jgi:hypothetical protein